MMNSSLETWHLDVDTEAEIPGWVFIPDGLDSESIQDWASTSADELCSTMNKAGWAEHDVDPRRIATALEAGADYRSGSEAVAMFQVWSQEFPAATMCHISIVASADLPDFTTLTDCVVQPFSAPFLGDGLQCTTSERVSNAEGSFDEVGVHLIFDNGDVSVLLSLEQAPDVLTDAALPGLAALAAVLIVRSEARNFVGVAPTGMRAGDEWNVASSEGSDTIEP